MPRARAADGEVGQPPAFDGFGAVSRVVADDEQAAADGGLQAFGF